MAIQDALVILEQRQNARKCVIIGNQWKVVVALARKIVDLQVVVCLGGFWERGMHCVVRVIPLPFGGRLVRVCIRIHLDGGRLEFGRGHDARAGAGTEAIIYDAGGEGAALGRRAEGC